MKRVLFRLSLISMLMGATCLGTAAAQDFQKSYRIGAGGDVRIGTISGDVKVTGADVDAILVTGYKEGRDRELLEFEDRSSATSVDVRAHYPKHCNCNASIRFEVQVPRSVKYDYDSLASVSGEVEVRGVSGRVRASSVSGTVRVENVTGTVNASSVSGNVEVEINRLDGAENMKFSTVSGNVSVRIPSDLDADIEMSSLSGSLKSDFPVEVREERYGPGRSARGRAGDGSRSLRMSSVSGNINLRYSTQR
jgi:DUF4097 and DUF4098 domain-containing protein YvlB